MGLSTTLAIKMFKEELLTLPKAAKLAGCSLEMFIDLLGKLGIPIVQYSKKELEQELKDFQ